MGSGRLAQLHAGQRDVLQRRRESGGAATHARGAWRRWPARLIIEAFFRKGTMPHETWTRQQADDYLMSRRQQYWSGGLIEDLGLSGYDTTAQKYEMRAAKTKAKIAQNVYVNKHGVTETRAQLINRKVTKDIERAKLVDDELAALGKCIAALCTGSEFIQGPIKTYESAIRKTLGDNKGIWTDNKDLTRCTIAHNDPGGVAQIASTVMRICQPIYGMKLIKEKEAKKTPTNDNPLGYSGWNFAVVFKDSKIPAEMQVNTFAMMYSKMSKDEFTKALLQNDQAKYLKREESLKFPGGLQHLLYEIVRDKQATEAEREAAREFGIWYTNLPRLSEAERPSEAQKCCARYQAFCDSLTSPFAINLISRHPLDPKWGVKPVKPLRAVRPRSHDVAKPEKPFRLTDPPTRPRSS
jgi:hypothetical protein